MNTIFNFGDPHKDFSPIAKEILQNYEVAFIPITNNKIFYSDKLQIVDTAYGFAQVWDSLSMMKRMRKLSKHDYIIFLGSMGSLRQSENRLDDLVVPDEVHYACCGHSYDVVVPEQMLLRVLKIALPENKRSLSNYIHGSVRAVFDPTTNHKTYTNRLYDNSSITGLDCSESYAGLKFCETNQLYGAVLLYCSDDPVNKITKIPKEEFDKRALKRDLELHHIANEVLKRV